MATSFDLGDKLPTGRLFASSPAAGFPAPGDDLVEANLNLHNHLVSHPESTFFVRVAGDSMEGVGIFSNDILVVDRSVEVKHGAIVIAVVEGGLVVKRLKISQNQLWLESANCDYDPIAINKEEGCYIWGVVTGSVRRF